jgi:hypothetical protein
MVRDRGGGADWVSRSGCGRTGQVQKRRGFLGGAGPLTFARFPLTASGVPLAEAGFVTVGPRPFAAGFAVEQVHAKHKKTPTHGVETKETCNILDGTDEPDTVEEPYEDEE